MAVMEVFCDASEMGEHLSVGALLFRKKHTNPFEKEWRQMLNAFGLTHFHMTDCNAGKGEFRSLSNNDCDQCARRAIAIILKYATKGTIFSIRKADFYEIITREGIVPDPFTLGTWIVLFDIAHWADSCDPSARISYFFESGDEHQNAANRLLTGIQEDEQRRERFRFRAHAFVPKLESYPAQAADMLAWHGAKHIGRRTAGNYRLRGDFQEIISRLNVADAHYGRDKLEALVEIAERHAGPRGNMIAGLAYRYHALSPKEQARELEKVVGGKQELEELLATIAIEDP